MKNYADLLFTDAVRAYQDEAGMGDKYEEIYKTRHRGYLDEPTIEFLQARSSFYMATSNEHGWPYVQHRGGPIGFIKVLAPNQIGFADYLGNRQFISRGNLDHSSRVSLFFMDYANRKRLKMQGEASMVNAVDAPELAASLTQLGEGPVERLVSINILAMDWNCPKYIEPRYTKSQMFEILAPQIAQLVNENEALKAELAELKSKN